MISEVSQSCCAPTRVVKEGEKRPSCCGSNTAAKIELDTTGMIRLEGGEFWKGEDKADIIWPEDSEAPVRRELVEAFYLDATAVSIAQFQEFVEATGYNTEAEQFGWSYLFKGFLNGNNRQHARGISGEAGWWVGVDGACWKRPEGPGSNVKKRGDHPVTHVSWSDAMAYCEWAGKRLPTDSEWEYACRGGLERKIYPWGDELMPKGKNGKPTHRMNIWQGKFPSLDTGADGFVGTAPVKSFLPNEWGFYNMTGNIWEWCADWFTPDDRRVVRGGSFMCHASYCNRYRCSARTGNTPDSSTSHTGFRCAADI